MQGDHGRNEIVLDLRLWPARQQQVQRGNTHDPKAAIANAMAARFCRVAGESSTEFHAMNLILTSQAFQDGGEIPVRYTCKGADVSPPLAWCGVPPNARSLVLIVDDPDAPDPAAPRMTWVHWLLYNIPPSTGSLAEGIAVHAFPAGTLEGTNDFRKTGYGGPCPPIGRHRYFFKLYALDTMLSDLHRPARGALERAMKDHVIAHAELVGTFRK